MVEWELFPTKAFENVPITEEANTVEQKAKTIFLLDWALILENIPYSGVINEINNLQKFYLDRTISNSILKKPLYYLGDRCHQWEQQILQIMLQTVTLGETNVS
ncbi:hypothetical protein BpHYR1_010468 [Brachionus plicatilis]|uniref:Uncharacterized protein n=1 Tax=Brachionus plicatilis TaxID=10195 RepID=A0A3M7T0Y1_BRAPC|nr:hypothetical protein BpHYR1_010468 [Brachionus plicatilis]